MFAIRFKLAFDFGSYKVRIANSKEQENFEDLNVVRLERLDNQPLVFRDAGHEALNKFTGQNDQLVWPVEKGVISKYLESETWFRWYRRKFATHSLLKPQIIMVVPAQCTDAEKRTALDTVLAVFVQSDVLILEDLLAIVVGLGLEENTSPTMVLGMGAGSTTIGIAKGGEIIHSKRLPFAGNWIDVSIQRLLCARFGFYANLLDCRDLKHQVGAVVPDPSAIWYGEIRDTRGIKHGVEITFGELGVAIEKGLDFIGQELQWFLKEIPTDYLKQASARKVYFCGGSSNLVGISQWLGNKLDLSLEIAQQPERTVISGARKLLDVEKLWRKRIVKSRY